MPGQLPGPSALLTFWDFRGCLAPAVLPCSVSGVGVSEITPLWGRGNHRLRVAVTLAGIPETLGTQKDGGKQKLQEGQQGWDGGWGSKEKQRVCASLCFGLETCGEDLAKRYWGSPKGKKA